MMKEKTNCLLKQIDIRCLPCNIAKKHNYKFVVLETNLTPMTLYLREWGKDNPEVYNYLTGDVENSEEATYSKMFTDELILENINELKNAQLENIIIEHEGKVLSTPEFRAKLKSVLPSFDVGKNDIKKDEYLEYIKNFIYVIFNICFL